VSKKRKSEVNQQDRAAHTPAPGPVNPTRARVIPKHRRCPLCFGGLGGVGRSYATAPQSGTLIRTYYKCNQCAHTWSVDVRKTILKIESTVREETTNGS